MTIQNILTLPRISAIKLPGIATSSRIFWVLTFTAIFSLLVICALEVQGYIKDLYALNNYENQLSQLSQNQNILEVGFSKTNSLNRLESYAQIFEKAGKIEYVKVLGETAMAK